MTPRTESDDQRDIKERIARLEEASVHRGKQMDDMAQDQKDVKVMVETLVADMNMRKGRDEVVQIHHVEGRQDDWQKGAWLRALLPIGLLAGAWTAFWKFVLDFVGGAP